ncbi:hypothetical protein PAXRUDRAFT_798813 [Paxillus rubicundulus Ve08.2h10]|uniref:Uncharacterized protein n=1 Tax=Paxillus rubicundulus Ve08.2h10 TaxID=930991 RepID=A0A0D0E6N1_9AGAM|nr:hypothetical protein PAXRUDRAFT_798813 [Paxillus rubicundulus Ve08.2h10]
MSSPLHLQHLKSCRIMYTTVLVVIADRRWVRTGRRQGPIRVPPFQLSPALFLGESGQDRH